jgi:hypothetical protein
LTREISFKVFRFNFDIIHLRCESLEIELVSPSLGIVPIFETSYLELKRETFWTVRQNGSSLAELLKLNPMIVRVGVT